MRRPLTELLEARTRVAAFVGAGGKTSLIYALGRQFADQGGRVVVTTTTRMLPPPRDLLLLNPESVVPPFRLLTVGSAVETSTGKLVGFAPKDMASLLTRLKPDLLLVEADGAAGRSIKAPASHEPVIPALADLVVGVMGLDAVGRIVDETTVFRLERFCAVTGLAPGETIGPQACAALAAHPEGLFKGAPNGARRVAFHNKADLHPPLGLTYGSARLGWFVSVA
ncbi:selenium cofactor biosynthesis protein YqeC [Desulfovibrio aminophilus]|uniref:selenium cofactor biosynthesis protein YqeC n=1 Tax=Desulfovibrio aminophilus TaxID=81425 RepID=UPI00339750D3